MAEPAYRETLRAQSVALAGAILEREGVEAVQARRIAREAGCSVGTLYNLFGDIDGLLIAVNAATLELLGSAVRTEGEALAGEPLDAQLTGLALAYMRFALTHRQRWEAVFKHRMKEGREVPKSYVEDQDRLLGVIASALGGIVPDDTCRMATARGLFGAVHGIVALALDNRLGGRLGEELEAQLRRIVKILASGLEAMKANGPEA
ncbi:MAG: TetR/AcrR family transcriptional regulator [Hyphomicrobiaceae bacterium]|nr:TetR/AcrR family transcriptional regulator [Hyphomicrobiaceae bacterium]